MALHFKKVNDFIERLPDWVAYSIMAITMIGIYYLGMITLIAFFLYSTWIFISFLLLIPSVSWLLSINLKHKIIQENRAKIFRSIALTTLFFLALVVGMSSSFIRDNIGESIIPGYHVVYSEGTDGDGYPVPISNFTTNHWFYTAIVYTFQPIIYIILILFIWLTFVSTTKMIHKSKKGESLSQVTSQQNLSIKNNIPDDYFDSIDADKLMEWHEKRYKSKNPNN